MKDPPDMHEQRNGFELLECREPTAPGATAPASVIFICTARIREQTDVMEPQRVESH